MEDVALAIGQSLCEALGDRRGCIRMGLEQQTRGTAAVEVWSCAVRGCVTGLRAGGDGPLKQTRMLLRLELATRDDWRHECRDGGALLRVNRVKHSSMPHP